MAIDGSLPLLITLEFKNIFHFCYSPMFVPFITQCMFLLFFEMSSLMTFLFYPFLFSLSKIHRTPSNTLFKTKTGRRRLLTLEIGLGVGGVGANRDQYSFHPPPSLRLLLIYIYIYLYIYYLFDKNHISASMFFLFCPLAGDFC